MMKLQTPLLLLILVASCAKSAPMIYQYQWFSPVYFYQPVPISNSIDLPYEVTANNDAYPDICTDSDLTLIAHPDDCSKYYFCWKGNEATPSILMSCPMGTFFDPSMSVCNWQGNVQCGAQQPMPQEEAESRTGDNEIDLRIQDNLLDEKIQEVENEATNIIEAIEEKVEEVMEEVEDTKEDLKDVVMEISDKVEQVKEDASEVVEKTETELNAVGEDLEETIKETMDDEDENIEEIKDAVEEKVEDIKNAVEEKVEEIKEDPEQEMVDETEESRDPKGQVEVAKEDGQEMTTVGFICRAAWCQDDYDTTKNQEDKELEALPTATANEDNADAAEITANEGLINEQELEDTTDISVDDLDLEEEVQTDASLTEYEA